MSVEEPGSTEVPRWLQVSAGWSWRLLLVAAAAGLAITALVILRPIVLPVFLAVLIAAYLRPVVSWLKARGVPRGAAAGLGVLLFVVVVAGFAALGGYAIADQSDVLADRIQDGADELEELAADQFGEEAVRDARARIDEAGSNLQETGTRGAIKVASVAVEVVTGAFLTLFALFYVLRDGERIWLGFCDRLDGRKKAFAHRAGRHAWGQLKGYMYGTAAIAAVDAVLIGLGAFLLSVPSALAIGLLTFALSFVPFVGAVVAGLFAVLLALADGGVGQALAMLGVVVVVQQVESNLLQPLIQSRFVALHPLAIILAVAAGATVAGFVGVLIAVPIVAVVVAVWNDLEAAGFFRQGELEEPDPA